MRRALQWRHLIVANGMADWYVLVLIVPGLGAAESVADNPPLRCYPHLERGNTVFVIFEGNPVLISLLPVDNRDL